MRGIPALTFPKASHTKVILYLSYRDQRGITFMVREAQTVNKTHTKCHQWWGRGIVLGACSWKRATLHFVWPPAGLQSVLVPVDCKGGFFGNQTWFRVTHSQCINYWLSQFCINIFWLVSTLGLVWLQAGQPSLSSSSWWTKNFWNLDIY